MKNISLLTATILLSLSISAPAFADSELWQNKAQREVAVTVQHMFNALSSNNVAQYNKLVTPDFFLYDVGERLSRDAFAELIQKNLSAGVKIEWKVTKAEAHIDKNLAWITYTNKGSFEGAKGKKHKTWLESAVLERSGKRWRLRFLHSTLATE